MRALFKAAEDRITLLDAKRKRATQQGRADPTRCQQPRRDLAMFALLYYTGLRASELTILRRDQYTGTHLLEVAREGANVVRRLYVPKETRRALDDCLGHERHRDNLGGGGGEPLFVATRSGGYLLRDDLAKAFKRIGQEANKHREDTPPIALHPHRCTARPRPATGRPRQPSGTKARSTSPAMPARPTKSARQ